MTECTRNSKILLICARIIYCEIFTLHFSNQYKFQVFWHPSWPISSQPNCNEEYCVSIVKIQVQLLKIRINKKKRRVLLHSILHFVYPGTPSGRLRPRKNKMFKNLFKLLEIIVETWLFLLNPALFYEKQELIYLENCQFHSGLLLELFKTANFFKKS